MVKIEDSNASEFVIDELKKWTEYRVWMLAGTIVGDGPSSYPVLVRTGEDGMRYSQIFWLKNKNKNGLFLFLAQCGPNVESLILTIFKSTVKKQNIYNP